MTDPANEADTTWIAITDTEELGRGIFSGQQARLSRQHGIPASVFRERDGHRGISVDRLSVAPIDQAVKNGEAIANARGPNRTFYGWAVISATDVRKIGCDVEAAPLADGSNPYHANIILPESVVADSGEQDQYAQRLAIKASWKERPSHFPL